MIEVLTKLHVGNDPFSIRGVFGGVKITITKTAFESSVFVWFRLLNLPNPG